MAPFAAYPLFIPNKAGKRIRETAQDTRFNGTVRFYRQSRGYGFIARDDSSKDVFVHAIALERSGIPAIDEGEKVSFEVDDDPRGRGKQAADLKLGLCGRRAALVGHLLGEASTPFGWTPPKQRRREAHLRHNCSGTVRYYDIQIGQGWIAPDGGGSDISVNQAAVNAAGLGQLISNQKIGFEVNAGPSGRSAVDLWATWANR